MNIIADLHTHTTFSHGKGSMLDNVTAAMTRGLQAVAITDHGPHSAPWVRASLRSFAQMRRKAADLDRRSVGLRVLSGVECNIISAKGNLDLPIAVRQHLDIVLAGLHPGVWPRSGSDWLVLTGGNWAARLGPGMRRRARVNNTRAVVEAVYTNVIDVITHPGYHLEIDTRELARACAARDTAMEINARHGEMTAAFCHLAAQEGARFVINSDAHRPEDVGGLRRGIAVAQAAGLSPDLIINSDRGGLFHWLERKRGRHPTSLSGWADWTEQRPLNQEEEPVRLLGAERRRNYRQDWSEQGKIH